MLILYDLLFPTSLIMILNIQLRFQEYPQVQGSYGR